MNYALLFAVLFSAFSVCLSNAQAEGFARVRPPALAGTWYPADPSELRKTVEGFISSAQVAGGKGRVIALIAPHAGYVYSGRVAGWAYRQVAGSKVARAIVIAPSHYGAFRGFSIMAADAYRTPLGEVPLDGAVCEKLRAHPLHVAADRLHIREHAIEIQVPFLQTAIKDFKLVPVLVGSLESEDASKIAAALGEHLSSETIVVASSDFTHYGPNYGYVPFQENIAENLRKLDLGAVELILKKDFDAHSEYCRRTGATICGRNPIGILLKLLPKAAEGNLLNYDTSGRMTGDYTNSVSYVSIVFRAPADKDVAPADALTEAEMRTLLKIARDALETFVRTQRQPLADANSYPLTPRLEAKGAAFVTLKRRGQLRGCIGRIAYPELADQLQPLWRTVEQVAVEAASRDPRFQPVRTDELEEIAVEVSVLSQAVPIASPQEFVVGRHGIIIRKGARSAVFLPQVASEQGWNREQTLAHLCLKAGLHPDEWMKPGMSFFVFTAQVFSEAVLHQSR